MPAATALPLHAAVACPPPLPAACRLPSLQCILALKSCHRDNPIAKYWGVCNAAAYALNLCLAEEKVTRRCVRASVCRSSIGRDGAGQDACLPGCLPVYPAASHCTALENYLHTCLPCVQGRQQGAHQDRAGAAAGAV